MIYTRLTLEPFSNVRHLLVDPLLLQLPDACTADVRNELTQMFEQLSGQELTNHAHLRQASHVSRHGGILSTGGNLTEGVVS